MTRHFLQLYLSIVLTLAAVSWGQNRLWETYARQSTAPTAERGTAALSVVEAQLRDVAPSERPAFVADLAARSGVDLELFDPQDIAGEKTLERLRLGSLAFMSEADGRTWVLKQLADDGRVLALRYLPAGATRSPLEWALAFAFYAAIALVIMMWLWPLTRDLRKLERSTMMFGDRNWRFDADIAPRSPVHSLAQAFRRMALRIDSLIRSHQDLSNAMSHEIKTPLARMRFEIEMARTAKSPEKLAEHLNNIDSDVAELNSFVTATLDYAILERAEVALNLAEHDFTAILPAVTDSVRRGAPPHLNIRCEVSPEATRVSCDAHLMETVLRNLLYNAIRYARSAVRVRFGRSAGDMWTLRVDDDGPGIPEADRQRVFESFVQLGEKRGPKGGYGLGLAIVDRVLEWHGGEVSVGDSDLGGASFAARWPQSFATRAAPSERV